MKFPDSTAVGEQRGWNFEAARRLGLAAGVHRVSGTITDNTSSSSPAMAVRAA
jgi:hypothetical protein